MSDHLPPERGEVPEPLILVEEAEDDACVHCGWVEAIVGVGEARDRLAQCFYDEDGNRGQRPVGPACRVFLRPSEDYDGSWVGAEPDDDRAIEFWKVAASPSTSEVPD